MIYYTGKRRPFTVRQMRKEQCYRCQQPALHQWQVCANGNCYLPVCIDCDYALNAMALEFFKLPNRKALLRAYARRLRNEELS